MNRTKPRPFSEGKQAFLNGKKLEDNPYSPDQTYGNGINCREMWKASFENEELNYICSRTPKPDPTLIMEAEILIPQSSIWMNHSLSEKLSFYKESCKEGKEQWRMIENEKSLRRQIVKARFEKHGL